MSPLTRLSGRLAAAVGAIAATAIVLTGCSAPAAEPSQAGGQPGGTLVVALKADPITLFPWKAAQFQSASFLGNLYDRLTGLDRDMNVVPSLAESWDVSEDGLEVTFQLRSGVTFADGSALDSEDVKFSLDAIRNPDTGAINRSALASVASVDAPDAATVVLNLTAPDASLFAGLSSVGLSILSSDDTEEVLNTAPNGTGPFTFVDRTANQSLTVKRNAEYWGEPALVDEVEFRVIPDASAIVAALQSNNVQLALLDEPIVAQTAEAAGLNVVDSPQLSYHALQLNSRHDALASADARLAVQCAIDRQEVLDTAAFGAGEVTGPFTSGAFESDPSQRPCPERDLKKSAEYLEAAGVDGLTLNTIVSEGLYATAMDEAQNLKAQLAEANITLELEILESGAFIDRYLAGDYDAAVALNSGEPDPHTMYSSRLTSTGALTKAAGFNSPELDALFAEGKAELDSGKRVEIYDEISAYLEDNAVWVWLFRSNNFVVTTADVQGFEPMPTNGQAYQYLKSTTVR